MKREKLKIRSDGTGEGTMITVGDTQIDGVKSLRIEISGRTSKALLMIEVDVDIWLDAEIIRHGELPAMDSKTESPGD